MLPIEEVIETLENVETSLNKKEILSEENQLVEDAINISKFSKGIFPTGDALKTEKNINLLEFEIQTLENVETSYIIKNFVHDC